jgi:hypothetical protein
MFQCTLSFRKWLPKQEKGSISLRIFLDAGNGRQSEIALPTDNARPILNQVWSIFGDRKIVLYTLKCCSPIIPKPIKTNDFKYPIGLNSEPVECLYGLSTLIRPVAAAPAGALLSTSVMVMRGCQRSVLVRFGPTIEPWPAGMSPCHTTTQKMSSVPKRLREN